MSKNINGSDGKRKEVIPPIDKLINGANWIAVIIVGLSTAMLLFVMSKAILSNSENQAPKYIDVNYTLKVDSSQLKSFKDSTSLAFDKFIRQNNQKVIDEVNNSIKQQYQRMESILSVQEDKSKLFTFGAGFLAILVALATFFGFKSINEMKKSTIEAAEYEAKKIAEEKAKEVAEKGAKSEINIQMEQIKIDLEHSLKTLLVDENKKEVEENFKTKTQEIVNLENNINDLLGQVQVALDKLNQIGAEEKASDQPDTQDNKKTEDDNGEGESVEFN